MKEFGYEVQKNWKLLSLLCMVMMLQGCISLQDIKFDEEYEKQWYLLGEVKDVLISEGRDEDGFMAEDREFDSSINLGVLNFWESNVDASKELVIALIDSKVDTTHIDLSDHIWKNESEIPNNGIDDDENGFVDDYEGWNFADNTNIISSSDANALHGTHCAGIIAAHHNGIGTMGILGNTNVKLMILPIFSNRDDDLSFVNVCDAINYAQEMGADICNISSVCLEGEEELENIIQASDMYIVTSAGNYEDQFLSGLKLDDYPRYPACVKLENVVTVGSVNSYGEKSSFSNYSENFVDLFAPGEYIYSTIPNNAYGYESGTSMATPIATATIGMYYYCGYSIDESVEIVLKNYKHSVVKFDETMK